MKTVSYDVRSIDDLNVSINVLSNVHQIARADVRINVENIVHDNVYDNVCEYIFSKVIWTDNPTTEQIQKAFDLL